MVRLFEFRDLDKIMEIWLDGNIKAHPFIAEEYWKTSFDSVKSILPNAEVYVYENGSEILGFIGMDAEYIAGLFVKVGHQRKGIGHKLIERVKQKKRLSLHVYEKNAGAIAFYKSESFSVENRMTEKETGETEYRMVYSG